MIPGTIRKDLSLISQVFKTARPEWGMEGLRNSVDGVRNKSAPGQNEARDRRLQGDEEKQLLREAAKVAWHLHAGIVLAIETGMRRG